MGRGRGGYTQKQIWYLDSGGNKVTQTSQFKMLAKPYAIRAGS